MATIIDFENRASQKSDLKPFNLIKNERGTRVWKSENGLQIKAVKIGSNEYYEVSIIRGAKLGGLNRMGGKVLAKDAQNKVSVFATQFDFNFIKNPAKLIHKTDAGRQLIAAWRKLQSEFSK